MSSDESTGDGGYVLPSKYVELLKKKHFTYVSVYDGPSLVVWLPKPKAEVHERAKALVHKLYGRDRDFHVYPRTYIRDARAWAHMGMHEEAPLRVVKVGLRRFEELSEKVNRAQKEANERAEAQWQDQISNPRIEETGTYLGRLAGAEFHVWRDPFGYAHATRPWMCELEPGQKFAMGCALPPLSGAPVMDLAALAEAPVEAFSLQAKRDRGDVFEVPMSGRALVLSWQGEWSIRVPRERCVHHDPLVEAVSLSRQGQVKEHVGGAPASLFRSPVTPTEQLQEMIDLWGVRPGRLDQIRRWLDKRIAQVCKPSTNRPWPLSRLLMYQGAPLAELGDRRVTVYQQTTFGVGRRRVEASRLEISHQCVQNEEPIRIRFRPRGKRRSVEIFLDSHPDLVALLGWGHPDLQEQMVNTGPNMMSSKYLSCDRRWEQEFDSLLCFYLETHPLTRVVLDLRGLQVRTHRFTGNGDDDEGPLPIPFGPPIFGDRPPSAPSPMVQRRHRIFVSYHHTEDAHNRQRFEQDFDQLVDSVSVYPGEIETRKNSQAIIRRDIRRRVRDCDCLVVLVGPTAYTRKWIDYELRTALDPRGRSQRSPVMALLTPELTELAGEINSIISAARRTRTKETLRGKALRAATRECVNKMVSRLGFCLPLRLLDNLLSGYAVLAPWPEHPSEFQALMERVAEPMGTARNGRPLMDTDLAESHASHVFRQASPVPAKKYVTLTNLVDGW